MATSKATSASNDPTAGLSAETEVEIEHKDGRAYGVTVKAFRDLYQDEGFTVTRLASGKALTGRSAPLHDPKAAKADTAKDDGK